MQLAAVHVLSQEFPGLSGLHKRLARGERRRASALLRRLRHSGRGLDAAITAVRHALRQPPRHPRATAGPMVPALTECGDAVEERFADIDARHPATIHRARKELRRFRYLAEVFEPVVPAITQARLDRLQSLQSEMGRIQDATVLNATVDRYLSRHAKAAGEFLRTRDALERRRADLIEAFLRRRPGPREVGRG